LDRIAGSRFEERDVDIIRESFEEAGLEVRMYGIDVLTWEHDQCEVEGIDCVPIPPTIGDGVEGILTNDVSRCEDRILIASTTSFPDNMWNIYNEAIEGGARAVIFYDYYPGRYRKIVVSGVWSYGYRTRSRASIPAIHIRLEDGVSLVRRAIGKRVYIDMRARTRISRGVSVEAIAGGRGGGFIVISAHHDRWFNSYRDDYIGVEILMSIARLAGERGAGKYGIKILSFTAEEFGDPEIPAWYWAYGSRLYASRAQDPGEMLLAIVIDTAFREPIRVSHTSPDHVKELLKGSGIDHIVEGYGHPYTDAPSLWRLGVPTITLHNLEELYPLYHTNLDVENMVRGFSSIISRALFKRIREVDPTRVSGQRISEDLRMRMPQDLYRRLEDRISGEGFYRLVRCINTHTMEPIYVGDYREKYRDMTTDPFPYWIAYRASQEGWTEHIRIPGNERIIYRGTGAGEAREIRMYMEEAVDRIIECVKA
jgi:Iap family predicted aminopeptidase